MTLSQEKIIYLYLRENPVFYKYVEPHFLADEEIRALYKVDKKFISKYNEIATKEQLIQVIQTDNIREFYYEKNGDLLFDEVLIDRIFDTEIEKYDRAWLEENIRTWVEWKNLETSLHDAVRYVKTNHVTADNITNIVDTVKRIVVDKNTISFDDDLGSDVTDVSTYFTNPRVTFTSGYKWLDKCLGGGFAYNTLTVLFAPPKVGKCVTGESTIKIRNKKTGIIEEISIEEFYNKMK